MWIVKEVYICPYEQMVYVPPRRWEVENSLGFWVTHGSPNLGKTIRPSDSQPKRKKRTCRIVDFAVPADNGKTERKRRKR